ncbi:hypothetical protein AAHE18_10G195300 [Arachis hypogaea]
MFPTLNFVTFIYITVENENRDVTYTKDTQEGLEMLNIFKSYSVKTSLLDDFDFYENREKFLCSDKKFKGEFDGLF